MFKPNFTPQHLWLTLVILLPIFANPAKAQNLNYEPNQVLIKWQANRTASQKGNIKNRMAASTLKNFHRIHTELLQFDPTQKIDVQEIIAEYQDHPDIAFIEPNYIISPRATIPNAPAFNDLWGLNNTGQNNGIPDVDINAPEAWDIATSSPDIVVAVIDSGIDWTHDDLRENIWVNPGEYSGPLDVIIYDNNANSWIINPAVLDGADNDNNGYTDDVIGWDFRNDDNNPLDDNGRGTHCAGIIGAVGNNGIGVSGVSWDVKLAALKFISSSGLGNVVDAVAALEYALDKDIPISNNSYGISDPSNILQAAIQDAASDGHLFITEAGNRNTDNDGTPYYPASYDNDNIITVTAINRFGDRPNYASYGINSIDLGAPGNEIYSTHINNSYREINGTAAATAYVAGACALVWGANPNQTWMDIKWAILGTVTPMITLNDRTTTGGRLNLFSAMEYFNPPPLEPEPVCGSTFSDVGEAAGCYFNNQYTLDTICPDNAGDLVTVSFTFFDIEQSFDGSCPDVLRVFDGVGNTAPLIGEYCGLMNNFIPGPFTASNSSGCLTFEFETDGAVIRNGWNALVGCISGAQACRDRDSLVLVDLYNATDGENWTIPWDLNTPMDNWEGVTLENGCVTKLFLNENNLNGTFPDEIGMLENLTDLGMDDNFLSGGLPASIGNLNNLVWFYMNNNSLTGTIPFGLGAADNLFYIGLGNNQLSGSIPRDLANLSKLSILLLENNNLTGIVPEGFGNMASLTSLILENNQLSGPIPTDINDIPNLVRIELQNNQFTFDGLEEIDSNGNIFIKEYAPQATIPLQESNGIFSVDAGGNINNNTYYWYRDGTLVATTPADSTFTPTQPGDYYCEIINNLVTDEIIPTMNLVLTSETITYAGELVWPGDLNNDGVSNTIDATFWGLALGNTGPMRPNASIDWIGQPAPTWTTNIMGVGGQHQDANGDGIVDFGDLQAIDNNEGFTTSSTSLRVNSDGTRYYLERLSVNIIGQLRYAIYLENNNNTLPTHGFACSIGFGSTPVDTAYIDDSSSCLGNNIEQVSAYNDQNNKLSFGLTRTDGIDQNCGMIGILIVEVRNNEIELGEKIILQAENGYTLSAAGNQSTVLGNDFTWEYNETQPNSFNMILTVSGIHEQCETLGEATVNIEGGTAPFNTLWSNGASTNTIENLSAGTYTATVTDNYSQRTISIEIERQFIPLYDENGFLVDCGETTCPPTLSLVNSVPDGLHQAGLEITCDGKVLYGTNTIMQAGEFIDLLPGFTVEPGVELLIEIDECGN